MSKTYWKSTAQQFNPNLLHHTAHFYIFVLIVTPFCCFNVFGCTDAEMQNCKNLWTMFFFVSDPSPAWEERQTTHTTTTLHRNTHNYNTTLNLTFLQLYSELNSNSQYCTVLHNALQICRTLQNLQNTRKCSKNVDIAVHLTTTLQVTLLEKHYRALYKTAKLCLTLQNTVRHYTTL